MLTSYFTGREKIKVHILKSVSHNAYEMQYECTLCNVNWSLKIAIKD